jgi:hypothetical protein
MPGPCADQCVVVLLATMHAPDPLLTARLRYNTVVHMQYTTMRGD